MQADQQFFNPTLGADKGLALRVIDKDGDHPTRVIINNAFRETEEIVHLSGVDASYSRKELHSAATNIIPLDCDGGSSVLVEVGEGKIEVDRHLDDGEVFNASAFVEELHDEIKTLKNFTSKIPIFKSMSFEKAEVLSKYHIALRGCEKIRAEDKHFFVSREWKRAVIKRNQAAYSLAHLLDKQEVKAVFESSSLGNFKSYGQKHGNFLQRSNQNRASLDKNEGSTLSDVQLNLVVDYKQHVKKVLDLYQLVDQESKETGVSKFKTTSSCAWLEAVKVRDQSAYQVSESIQRNRLKHVFKKPEMGKFLDSVKRHKAHVENSLPDGKQELVDDYLLKTNKASGLYRKCVDEAKKDGVSHYKTPFSKDCVVA